MITTTMRNAAFAIFVCLAVPRNVDAAVEALPNVPTAEDEEKIMNRAMPAEKNVDNSSPVKTKGASQNSEGGMNKREEVRDPEEASSTSRTVVNSKEAKVHKSKDSATEPKGTARKIVETTPKDKSTTNKVAVPDRQLKKANNESEGKPFKSGAVNRKSTSPVQEPKKVADKQGKAAHSAKKVAPKTNVASPKSEKSTNKAVGVVPQQNSMRQETVSKTVNDDSVQTANQLSTESIAIPITEVATDTVTAVITPNDSDPAGVMPWMFMAAVGGSAVGTSMTLLTAAWLRQRRILTAREKRFREVPISTPVKQDALPPDAGLSQSPQSDKPFSLLSTTMPLAETQVLIPKNTNFDGVIIADLAKAWFDAGTDGDTWLKANLIKSLRITGYLGSRYGLKAGQLSVVGPVRKCNEDCCLMFTLPDDRLVLLSADGMGGMGDGHLASRIATLAALGAICEAGDDQEDSLVLLQHGFLQAGQMLKHAVNSGRMIQEAGTTLIATIIEKDRYITGWMGDGGAWLMRRHGEIVPLMNVHKASSTVLDVYLAADNPEDWGPEFIVEPREPGDVVLLGSDGVMDRAEPSDILGWLAKTVSTQGLGMSEALRVLIDNFATLRNPAGSLVADDNMTLLAVRMPG
jgi:serine/threonine protein phosphatase PrpC